MTIRFWGVRGSIVVPGAQTARYGGNTSCVEIRCGKQILVFDGGSGLRPLGAELVRKGGKVDLDLIFSHTHLDHIVGLPFFAPCYAAGNHVRIWAGHLTPPTGIKAVLGRMMSAPLFPVRMDIMEAGLDFRDFTAGETLHPHAGIALVTAPLNHPGGATGYRVEFAGKSVAYITDTEHRPGESDANVLRLMQGADLAIYDCMYSEDEYQAHQGWGHSTWEEGVRLAREAGVKRLAIFHHEPDHDDDFMDRVAAAAAALLPGAVVAHEGLVITL